MKKTVNRWLVIALVGLLALQGLIPAFAFANETPVEPEEKEIRFHSLVYLAGKTYTIPYDIYDSEGNLVHENVSTGNNNYVVLEPGEYDLKISADQFTQNGIDYSEFVSYTRDNYDTDRPTMTITEKDLSVGSFDEEGNFTLRFTAARGTWNTANTWSYHRSLAWIGFDATDIRKVSVAVKSNDYQTEATIRETLIATYTNGEKTIKGGISTIIPDGDFHVSFSGIPAGMQAEAYLGDKKLSEGDLYSSEDQRIDLYVRPQGLPTFPEDLSSYRIETLSIKTNPVVEGVSFKLVSGGVELTPTQKAPEKFQQVIDQRPYTVTLEGLPANYAIKSAKLAYQAIEIERLSANFIQFTPVFKSMFPVLEIELEEVATHTVSYQVGDEVEAEVVPSGQTPNQVPAVDHEHFYSTWVDFVGWTDESGETVDPSTVTITEDRTFTASFVDKTELKLLKNKYNTVSNTTNPEILDGVLDQTNLYLSEQNQTQEEVDQLVAEFEAALDKLILGHRIVISPRDEQGKLIKHAHVILELVQDGEVKYTFDTSKMQSTGTGSYNSPVIENGDYTIRETLAPEGYELVEDVDVTIRATEPTGYKATFWNPSHTLKDSDEPTPEVDKSELQDLVEEAAAIDPKDYKDGVEELKEAMEHAKLVLDNDNATQEEVDAAAGALREALANLKKKDPADPDPTEPEQPGPDVRTIAGENRFLTSTAISRTHYNKADNVVLVNGFVYADALVASSYANLLNAPILLTAQSELTPSVIAEIERLGANKVTIVGGTFRVSEAIEAELKAKGLDVERIAGETRYETALEIAKRIMAINPAATPILASGEDFADALSANTIAVPKKAPVLITPKAGLHSGVDAFFNAYSIDSVIVVGGNLALTENVHSELNSLQVTHLQGDTRYHTALEVAKYQFKIPIDIYLATGRHFADALTAGAILGDDGAILLADYDSVLPEVLDYMRKAETVTIVGGALAIDVDLKF